jgi:hypothetical protein
MDSWRWGKDKTRCSNPLLTYFSLSTFLFYTNLLFTSFTTPSLNPSALLRPHPRRRFASPSIGCITPPSPPGLQRACRCPFSSLLPTTQGVYWATRGQRRRQRGRFGRAQLPALRAAKASHPVAPLSRWPTASDSSNPDPSITLIPHRARRQCPARQARRPVPSLGG